MDDPAIHAYAHHNHAHQPYYTPPDAVPFLYYTAPPAWATEAIHSASQLRQHTTKRSDERKGRRRGGRRHGRRKVNTSPMRPRAADHEFAEPANQWMQIYPATSTPYCSTQEYATFRTPGGLDITIKTNHPAPSYSPLTSPRHAVAASPKLTVSPPPSSTSISATRAWRRTLSASEFDDARKWNIDLRRTDSTDDPIPSSLLFAHNAVKKTPQQVVDTPRDPHWEPRVNDWPVLNVEDDEEHATDAAASSE